MLKKINIRGEDALLRTIPKLAQKRLFLGTQGSIVMRRSRWAPNRNYSTAMTLAWLLYPKNFPKMIASAAKERGITFSKQVQLTKKSQDVIDHYYESKRHIMVLHPHETREAYNKVAEEMRTNSGIQANTNDMNVGMRRKHPIFFEVWKIEYPRLIKFIRSMPESTPAQRLKKEQAISLLQSLDGQQDALGIIHCHREEPRKK